MKHTFDYVWFSSYNDTDTVWVDESLNWDEVFDLATSEYNALAFFAGSFFANAHVFLDWFVKLSFVDVMLINSSDADLASQTLFSATLWDESLLISVLNFSLPTFYHSDYQDLMTLFFYYTPELTLALKDYVGIFWLAASFSEVPAAVFDLYDDSASISTSEFIEYLAEFLPFIWFTTALVCTTRLSDLTNAANAYATRAYYYLYSMSLENRFQFEAGLQTFFLVGLYTSVMIATSDDDQEELLEFFNTMCFYFFVLALVFYFYKYSVHFFSFLEAAGIEPKASNMVVQFGRDSLNAAGLIIRYFVLMVRLNLYDFSDDLLDSYYIFLTDFNEEDYLFDAIAQLSAVMFFDSDNHEDRLFMLEDEGDLFTDLYILYFTTWGKLSLFWFFALEEMARIALALFITYLVIFEMNALDRSYNEDMWILLARERLYAVLDNKN